MWVTTPLLQKQVGKMKMAVIQKCLGAVQNTGRSKRRMEEQHLTVVRRLKRESKELRNRETEGDRRGRRRRRNHRADSACLCFHFPPQDRQSRGREMGD